MPELKLKDVSYKYRGSKEPVLRGITCGFREGELCAVVGPSGSGKSTLLSIMAGLDLPSGGAVWIDGRNLREIDLDAYRRECVTTIFQSFQLFPLLTVSENVSYPMVMSGASKKAAAERAGLLLDTLGIGREKHRRFPSNLSGGEQQRTAIARALATGAKVILADEPTGNLDSKNTKLIIDILKELAHKEDYCVVVVTHDQSVAELSDKVFQMADGILAEC